MDNKYKVVLFLAKKNESYTLHELSKQVKIPYTTLLRVVEELTDVTTIIVKGKAKLIQIKWNDITTSMLVVASFEEKKEFLKKHPLIKKISEQVQDVALVFGSYAKGTQTKNSDIDLITINAKGEKSVSFSNLEILYDIKINPMFFTKKEFKLMLQDKEENVVKQALKNHVLINGFKEFWEDVKNAISKRTL
ncbi:MAG: nucleotidyltransferase domain-containing protein [bacterium]